jgi:hypothetical protein
MAGCITAVSLEKPSSDPCCTLRDRPVLPATGLWTPVGALLPDPEPSDAHKLGSVSYFATQDHRRRRAPLSSSNTSHLPPAQLVFAVVLFLHRYANIVNRYLLHPEIADRFPMGVSASTISRRRSSIAFKTFSSPKVVPSA